MRILIMVAAALAVSGCQDPAPAVPVPPDTIAPDWTLQHVLLTPSLEPELWDQLRGRGDLVRSLDAIARDPTAPLTARMNAPGLMAAASDGTAARRLVDLWTSGQVNPVAILFGLGALDAAEAEAHPQVYDVLQGALEKRAYATAAAVALADLGTPRAAGILRTGLEREHDAAARGAIRRALERMEK